MTMDKGLLILVGYVLQCTEAVGEFQRSAEGEMLFFNSRSYGQEAQIKRTEEHIRGQHAEIYGLKRHFKLALQIVHPGKAAEGISILLTRKEDMSGERQVAALHSLMGDAVALPVIGMLKILVIEKKRVNPSCCRRWASSWSCPALREKGKMNCSNAVCSSGSGLSECSSAI